MLPRAAANLDEAHAAIELWEHYKRRKLDVSQRLVVEVMMALRSDGLWAAPTTGREMPRQNGKGDEIEVVELWDLVQRSARILHTVHDAVLLATESQSRLLDGCIEQHADLRRLKKRAWRGTGQQMIEMRNGGIIWYRTRTGGGARGVDEVDRIVVDEAQHAEEEHLAAITPTQLASANPQLNAMGSAGIAGKSAWWWRLRRRAVSDDPGDLGYVGHTAETVELDDRGQVLPSKVDPYDRRLWTVANPALANGRVGESFFDEQLRTLGPDLFAREHLGVWDPELGGGGVPRLPAEAWAATVGPDLAKTVPAVALVFDVDRDSASASLAWAAGDLGSPYVEVMDHRKGAGWVPQAVVEAVERLKPSVVACNGAGPAGALVGPVLTAFKEAGVHLEVTQMSGREYAQACGGFFTDVIEGRLRRPAGQTPLDNAAADATERLLGDAWVWDRRSATVPISPLVAVTIARALLPTLEAESWLFR